MTVDLCAHLPRPQKRLWALSKGDCFVWLVTFCCCLGFGVKLGIVAGVTVRKRYILMSIRAGLTEIPLRFR
jgi:MFS superfamily sulfate permease-like transporter